MVYIYNRCNLFHDLLYILKHKIVLDFFDVELWA